MFRFLSVFVLTVCCVFSLCAEVQIAPRTINMSGSDTTSAPAPSAGETHTLKTAYGTRFNAYFSGPEDAEKGVILVPDEWGLNDNIRQWADRFALLGYRAVAVDLYDSRHVSNARMAHDVMKSIDPVWIDADLKGALAYLKRAQSKIIVMGWGFGADYAFRLAASDPAAVSATVTYYGVPVSDATVLGNLGGPVLAVYANRDPRIARSTIDSFEQAMQNLNNTVKIIRVDAEAGFANPLNASFDSDLSENIWQATKAFLAKNLAVATPQD